MPTGVPDVFTVKDCNGTDFSNLYFGKASQYWEEFLWDRKSLCCRTAKK